MGLVLPYKPEQNQVPSLSLDICTNFSFYDSLGLFRNFLTDIPYVCWKFNNLQFSAFKRNFTGIFFNIHDF